MGDLQRYGVAASCGDGAAVLREDHERVVAALEASLRDTIKADAAARAEDQECMAVMRVRIDALETALRDLVDQGEPVRMDGELWSNWQPRVKEWKSARAILEAPCPQK